MTLLIPLNSSLGTVVSNIYVGDDGKLHKVIGGADTALNFSSTPSTLDIPLSVDGGADAAGYTTFPILSGYKTLTCPAKSHDKAYTAVYIGNTLVWGTVTDWYGSYAQQVIDISDKVGQTLKIQMWKRNSGNNYYHVILSK